MVDDVGGNGGGHLSGYGLRHDRDSRGHLPAPGRRTAPRLAGAPAAQSARPRQPGRGVDPTREFRRDGSLEAEPRDGAAARRASRRTAAGSQPAAARRRLRADLHRDLTAFAGHARDPFGTAPATQGSRTLSRAGRRSLVEPRRSERRNRLIYRGCSAAVAGSTDQRTTADPASRRSRTPDHQPRRDPREHPDQPATPDHQHGGPGPPGPVRRTARVLRYVEPGSPGRGRSRRTDEASAREARVVAADHDRDLRYAARRDRLRADDRAVLPGRRRHRRHPPRVSLREL